MVPEIGLTPETIARFREHNAPVEVLHSGLRSDNERLSAWLKAKTAKRRLSHRHALSLFTPFKNAWHDCHRRKEHGSSYKQQKGGATMPAIWQCIAPIASRSIILGSRHPSHWKRYATCGRKNTGAASDAARRRRARPALQHVLDLKRPASSGGTVAPAALSPVCASISGPTIR